MLTPVAPALTRQKSLLLTLFLLVCVAICCALPAGASAAFIVNSTADEPDAAPGGACQSAAGKCTLRAAIEVTNAAGVADNILFDATVFEGQLADTIALTSPLPAIEAPVSINAGTCALLPTPKPCAGTDGPVGAVAFEVMSDGVSISGLSIAATSIGILVAGESRGVSVRGNWIGVRLDGNPGGNNTGILVLAGSDEATIGGSNGVQRNVFGYNGTAIDLEGASSTVIRGNYVGVEADGVSPASNTIGVEITDSTVGDGTPAEANEIGEPVSGSDLTSEACDGGCNVIAQAALGIDLNGSPSQGEAPASGPTTIRGNYVGLGANGTTVSPIGNLAIQVGASDFTSVGGINGAAKNYIATGAYAINHEGGEEFVAAGNVIGRDVKGDPVTPPSVRGIFSTSLGVAGSPPAILGNDIRMAGGVGVEHRFEGALIAGNRVAGGNYGIRTLATTGGLGSSIVQNLVLDSLEDGIRVENDANLVAGNEVFDSGAAGVRVVNPAPLLTVDGNLIGGNEPESENLIVGSGEDAIAIVEESGEPGSANEIGRNHGDENQGSFIDLIGDANGGIQPPVIVGALPSRASGTADPGAKIRLFRKASPEAGELQSFLAEAVADGNGEWDVTYPAIPAGTIVAATQTTPAGATSELSTVTTDPDGIVIVDPICEVLGKCPKPDDKGKGDSADNVPPRARILKGPAGKSAKTTARFKFRSNEAGSTFQCKLDKRKFKKCKSPKTYKKLKPGKHVFRVRATDRAGNVGKPAKRKFTVLG